MTTPPTWTREPGDNVYTLISDNARCRVWFTSLDTWAASFFMHHGTSRAVYGFATADEAKAWCELQLAGRRMERS